MDSAKIRGVSVASFDHHPFGNNRTTYESALHQILLSNRIDLICLAGFYSLSGKYICFVSGENDTESPPIFVT